MEVNIWKQFEALTKSGVRTIGTVTFINNVQGTSTIQLRNGNTMTVKGVSVPVNGVALTIDNVIVAALPTLPQYQVTV